MKRLIYVKTLLNFNGVGLEQSINDFIEYSLKSMIQQTNQDFIARIIYDEKSEKIIRSFFNGDVKLPSNIVFISRKKSYGDLYALVKDYEEFYVVRWDAGFVYHNDYIQKLIDYKHDGNTPKIFNGEGYLIDKNNGVFMKVSKGKEPVHVYINNVHEYLNLQ